MLIKCKSCGWQKELGKVINVSEVPLHCMECGKIELELIDTGAVEVGKLDIDALANFVIEKIKSMTVEDLVKLFFGKKNVG